MPIINRINCFINYKVKMKESSFFNIVDNYCASFNIQFFIDARFAINKYNANNTLSEKTLK